MAEKTLEMRLLGAKGLPEGSLVSIRVGAVRRQAPLGSDRPYRFCGVREGKQPMKVDIYAPIAHARLLIEPGEARCSVPLDPPNIPAPVAGNPMVSQGEMCLDFEVADVDGGGLAKPRDVWQSDGESAAIDEKPGVASTPPTRPSTATSDKNSVRRHQIALEAQPYFEQHHLLDVLQWLLQAVIKEKPGDPYEYMIKVLQNSSRAVAGRNKDGAPQRPTSASPRTGPAPERPRSATRRPLSSRTPGFRGTPSNTHPLVGSAASPAAPLPTLVSPRSVDSAAPAETGARTMSALDGCTVADAAAEAPKTPSDVPIVAAGSARNAVAAVAAATAATPSESSPLSAVPVVEAPMVQAANSSRPCSAGRRPPVAPPSSSVPPVRPPVAPPVAPPEAPSVAPPLMPQSVTSEEVEQVRTVVRDAFFAKAESGELMQVLIDCGFGVGPKSQVSGEGSVLPDAEVLEVRPVEEEQALEAAREVSAETAKVLEAGLVERPLVSESAPKPFPQLAFKMNLDYDKLDASPDMRQEVETTIKRELLSKLANVKEDEVTIAIERGSVVVKAFINARPEVTKGLGLGDMATSTDIAEHITSKVGDLDGIGNITVGEALRATIMDMRTTEGDLDQLRSRLRAGLAEAVERNTLDDMLQKAWQMARAEEEDLGDLRSRAKLKLLEASDQGRLDSMMQDVVGAPCGFESSSAPAALQSSPRGPAAPQGLEAPPPVLGIAACEATASGAAPSAGDGEAFSARRRGSWVGEVNTLRGETEALKERTEQLETMVKSLAKENNGLKEVLRGSLDGGTLNLDLLRQVLAS